MAAAESWDEGIELGRHRVGRYLLTHELASGGMGTVYLGRLDGPKGFGKLVAVKLMHEQFRDGEVADMFADEARIASRIHHPNVCQVYDFGEEDGLYYLVMELLAGVPLSRMLAHLASTYEGVARPPSYFAMVARIMADVLAGLHAVHEATDDEGHPLEIVHRDISPENVFLTYDGAVRIVDFGIAGGRGRIHRTQVGTFKGKLAYAAPEQLRGKVTRTADIWSSGAVLYELLTLHCAFERENDAATLTALTTEPVVDPRRIAPDVPPELAAIALRALQRDPRARYRTAREMARELTAYAAQHRVVDPIDLAVWVQTFCPAEYEACRALLAQARGIGRPASSLAWAETMVDEPVPTASTVDPSGVRTLVLDTPESDSPPLAPPDQPVELAEPAEKSKLGLAIVLFLAAAATVAGAIAGMAL